MSKSLRSQIAIGKKKTGHDQSTFIRQAIVEKLQSLDVPVDPGWAFAPDRSKPFDASPSYPEHRPDNYVIHERKKPSSKADSVASKILKKLSAEVRNQSPK